MPADLSRLAAALALAWSCASVDAEAAEVRYSGGARGRYETLSGPFQPGLGGSDRLVTSRIAFAVEVEAAPVTFGLELLDSRAFLIDRGGAFAPGDVNVFEPIQTYVRVAAGSTEWTVGRFTQDLGSRRVISRSRAGNATPAFSGARGVWRGAQGESLTALYVMPMVRRPFDLASALENEHELDYETSDYRLYGAFYTSRPLAAGARADLYGFRLVDVDGGSRPTRDRRLSIFGARLFRTPADGALDYEVEAILQTGRARRSGNPRDVEDLDVSALGLHAEVGRSFHAAWRPRLEFALDYGSGDKDPADGEYNRFDGLFGSRRGDFGPGGLYGPLSRSNFIAPVLRLDFAPTPRWEGYVTYRPMWLAHKRDAFANTGVQDPNGRSGRFAGHQVEGRVRRRLGGHLLWETGGGWVLPEGFLERAPNATREGSTLYAYTDLTASF